MYEKFKNYTYKEFIEECFTKDEPFGLEFQRDCGISKLYVDSDVKIEVRTNKSNEISVTENYKTIFSYVQNGTYQSLHTPDISYHKNHSEDISFKEYTVNGICVTYLETPADRGYNIKSSTSGSKYVFRRSNIDIHSLETDFAESAIPNIYIKERSSAYMPTANSTVYFRAPDPTGKIRSGAQNVMYTMDISKQEDGVLVKIEVGYYKKFEFYIDAKDASVLNIFDDQCTFQAELGLESDHVKYLCTIRKAIVNKFKYAQGLGENPVVSTMLKNIKQKMKQ